MSLRNWVRNNLFSHVKRATASTEIKRYFQDHSTRLLNLGAGGNRAKGWLNVDRFPPPGVTFLDATQPLPFASGTFDAVLCEHMIEHIGKADAERLFKEIKRVLKPGGVARIVTPDLEWFARRLLEPPRTTPPDNAYLEFLGKFYQRDGLNWCDAANLCFYEHGHCYIWSPTEMSRLLERDGFTELKTTRAGEPVLPVFHGVEGHPRISGFLPNSLEAFAIEARS